MASAVDSIFDVAFWFADRALNDNEYLQSIKLQYLLYLSQSYFAAAYNGKKFFPAVFVAEDEGPIEPSLNRAWAGGRPNFQGITKLADDISLFTDSIWRRFGHHSSQHLSKLCRRTPAFQFAYEQGIRAEITLEQMMKDITGAKQLPELKQVVKPKLVRSSNTGRAVEITAWSPPILKIKKPPKT